MVQILKQFLILFFFVIFSQIATAQPFFTGTFPGGPCKRTLREGVTAQELMDHPISRIHAENPHVHLEFDKVIQTFAEVGVKVEKEDIQALARETRTEYELSRGARTEISASDFINEFAKNPKLQEFVTGKLKDNTKLTEDRIIRTCYLTAKAVVLYNRYMERISGGD